MFSARARQEALIEDNKFTYQVPAKPAVFDETLMAAAGYLLTKQQMTKHERKIKEYKMSEGPVWV